MTDLLWISFRAAQSYPIVDGASGLSKQGTYLNQSLLLDIVLNVASQKDENISSGFYISRIVQQPGAIDIYIAYSNILCALCSNIKTTIDIDKTPVKVLDKTVACRSFNISPVKQTQQVLNSYPWMASISGTLAVGDTKNYSQGSLTFDKSNTLLNPQCIHFTVSLGLLAIKVEDQVMTGIVLIKAGLGIIIDASNNIITVSVDPSYILSKVSVVTQALNPVKTINGVLPDSSGNISFTGLDCVLINPGNTGVITISNPCAKPCCGLTDTLQLNSQLQLLQSLHSLIKSYFTNMANTINYMQANLSTLMAQK